MARRSPVIGHVALQCRRPLNSGLFFHVLCPLGAGN